MYSFFETGSHSDRVIVAKKYVESSCKYNHLSTQSDVIIDFLKKEHPQNNEADIWSRIELDVETYNNWIEKVRTIPGFLQFLGEKGLCVSREEVSERFSAEEVLAIFDVEYFPFQTELKVSRTFHYPGETHANHLVEEFLYDTSLAKGYEVTIEGHSISLPIGSNGNDYPETIEGKRLIWNWTDNGRDFCCNLWFLLHDLSEQENCKDDEEPRVTYYFDDFYEQIRYDGYIEPQFVKAFKKLESLEYLKSYTIRPEKENLFWQQYGKRDGSIDVATLDMSFRKNKLLMEQLKLLICSTDEEVKTKSYFLTDENNRQYMSEVPGTLGGHSKLKIYGKLDCPSANRYLNKGQYSRQRVFFADERTAIVAGYRPCAKCMPEAYDKWKMGQVE